MYNCVSLLSWIILLFCVMDFFFTCTYLCYFFFFWLHRLYIYIYIKLTIMVINIKLVIGHYILKSIPAQNKPNCTAHMTAKLKFDVMMVLTKLDYKVLTKKIQNYTKLHCKYPYVKPINIQKYMVLYQKKKKKNCTFSEAFCMNFYNLLQ